MRTRRQQAVRAETGVSRGATSPAEGTWGLEGSQACVSSASSAKLRAAFAAEGGRGGIGASRPESRGPFFVGPRPGGTRMKFKLEYIWLDGYEPVPNLRSKTKIVDFETEPTLEQLPLWNFDGSSTRQADGSSSDCFLQPVALFPDPARNQRPSRHVRSAAARRDAASVEQPRLDPGRPRRLVRLRAGVLPLQGRLAARVPEAKASPRRRASTTRASASRTRATSHGRSSTSTSTSASRPASRSKASTRKWRRASGSSRSSARAPSAPPTSSGSPAT